MRIGFVGLGRMGANMVRRLLRGGHEVVAYNRTPEKTKEIAGEGATAAFSIGELIDAQAKGDFEAIEAHDLPIIRIHLADPETGLAALESALATALEATIQTG